MKKLLVALAVLVSFTAQEASAGGGTSVFEIGAATAAATPVLITASAGTLYDVEIGTGAAGDYVQCFDSNTVSGILLSAGGTASAPEIATLSVAATNTTTRLQGVPAAFRKFDNGLVCLANAARRIKVLWAN